MPRASVFERLLRGAGLPAHGGAAGRGGQRVPRRVAGRRGRGPGVRRARGGARARPRDVAVPGRGAGRAVPGGRVQLRPAAGPGARTGTRHALPDAPADPAAHDRGSRARVARGAASPGWSCLPESAFAWLLPAVGFVAVVLAVSTWVSPLRAAVAVSSAWLAVIWLLAARIGSPDAVLQARAQAGFLALAAASFAIFLVRRCRLRQLGRRTVEVVMATASISLRGVGRTFGATRALAGVDLDLRPGVTGLLGPNGAGKTTLLRLLATALPPSQGQVLRAGPGPGGARPNAPASAASSATSRRRSASRAASPPSRSWTTSRCSRSGPSRPPGTPKCAACSTWWGCPASAPSGSGPCPAASAGGSRWPRRCSARRRC